MTEEELNEYRAHLYSYIDTIIEQHIKSEVQPPHWGSEPTKEMYKDEYYLILNSMIANNKKEKAIGELIFKLFHMPQI
jgi:hypothetical protein